MILQIRLNLDIFTVWKKLKNSVVKCEKTFSLVERLKARKNLNLKFYKHNIIRQLKLTQFIEICKNELVDI